MSEILNRRSVRKFDLTKKVSHETLIELCKYAESAPSARNQKSREYIIIEDEAIINSLAPIAIGTMFLKDCNTVIAVIGKNPENLATPVMQAQDLSAATENILIHATELGIGSCWLGVYPHEDRINPMNEILGVKNGAFVFSLIALGYPKDPNPFYDKEKFNKELIHINRY